MCARCHLPPKYDQPAHTINLGLFYLERGDAVRAEGEYRAALRLRPDFAGAYANLADLYRALGREQEGETTLDAGLRQAPADGDLLHAKGLLRVRQQRLAEALPLLDQAARARPDNPHYAYVHAVALHEAGRRRESLAALEQALARFPDDAELLATAAGYARAAGQAEAAERYAQRLATTGR